MGTSSRPATSRSWSCCRRMPAGRRSTATAAPRTARATSRSRTSICGCPCSDGPGAAGGQVAAAPPLPLPCGMAIAPEYSSASYLRASLGERQGQDQGQDGQGARRLGPGLDCVPRPGQAARDRARAPRGRSAKKKKKKAKVLGKRSATIAGGQSATVKVKLSKHGRSAVSAGPRHPGEGDHRRRRRRHRADQQGEAQEQEAQEEVAPAMEARVSATRLMLAPLVILRM